MLLTSAADSTAGLHSGGGGGGGGGTGGSIKFQNYEYSHISCSAAQQPPPSTESAFVAPNIEVNIAEVSSTTDIITPKSETPPQIKCNGGYGTIVKPEPGQSITSSVTNTQSFFPANQFTFHHPTSNNYYSYHNPNHPNHYSDIFHSSPSATPNMNFHAPSHISSLISIPNSCAEDIKPPIGTHCHDNMFRSHESVAMAAARARAVSNARNVLSNPLEEQVISQQRANRRQMHKICEQKRRDGLKSALETLKMTIPGCSILSDQSQQNILLKAYQFVCDLLRKQQSNKVIIEELQSIKEKNNMLQAEIEYFKKEYKKLSMLGDSIQPNPQKPTSTTVDGDRGVVVT